jgi:hypothetical protein
MTSNVEGTINEIEVLPHMDVEMININHAIVV